MNKSILQTALLAGVLGLASTAAQAGGNTATPDWTGFHAGASLGIAASNVTALPIYDPSIIRLSNNTQAGNSFNIGANLGYDHQIGPLVVGALVELNYLHIATHGGFNEDDATNQPWGTQVGDLLGSARIKLGAGSDQVMVYGSGGIAFGSSRIANWKYEGFGAQDYPFASTGYVLGGGIEYRVNDSWTISGDYSHYVFTASNTTQIFSDDRPTLYGGNNKIGIDLIKVGLNYRF